MIKISLIKNGWAEGIEGKLVGKPQSQDMKALRKITSDNGCFNIM